MASSSTHRAGRPRPAQPRGHAYVSRCSASSLRAGWEHEPHARWPPVLPDSQQLLCPAQQWHLSLWPSAAVHRSGPSGRRRPSQVTQHGIGVSWSGLALSRDMAGGPVTAWVRDSKAGWQRPQAPGGRAQCLLLLGGFPAPSSLSLSLSISIWAHFLGKAVVSKNLGRGVGEPAHLIPAVNRLPAAGKQKPRVPVPSRFLAHRSQPDPVLPPPWWPPPLSVWAPSEGRKRSFLTDPRQAKLRFLFSF